MKLRHANWWPTALFYTLIGGFSVAPCALADWMANVDPTSSAPGPQDIVISLKLDPKSNPEAACLSVTLARSLRGDFSAPTGNNVTLFPTLDGVALGDGHLVSSPRFRCTVPQEGVISLQENLEDFLCSTGDRTDCYIQGEFVGDANGNMVICPICWEERYGDEDPFYGFLPPPDNPAVGKMILDAEKILDF